MHQNPEFSYHEPKSCREEGAGAHFGSFRSKKTQVLRNLFYQYDSRFILYIPYLGQGRNSKLSFVFLMVSDSAACQCTEQTRCTQCTEQTRCTLQEIFGEHHSGTTNNHHENRTSIFYSILYTQVFTQPLSSHSYNYHHCPCIFLHRSAHFSTFFISDVIIYHF